MQCSCLQQQLRQRFELQMRKQNFVNLAVMVELIRNILLDPWISFHFRRCSVIMDISKYLCFNELLLWNAKAKPRTYEAVAKRFILCNSFNHRNFNKRNQLTQSSRQEINERWSTADEKREVWLKINLEHDFVDFSCGGNNKKRRTKASPGKSVLIKCTKTHTKRAKKRSESWR